MQIHLVAVLIVIWEIKDPGLGEDRLGTSIST